MISVCMATYNGEKFIREQIDSILYQLNPNDELIISDDNSSDSTNEIIESYNDNRIKLYHTNFHSPIKNFEYAIRHAKGEYIFLSDQDDVWLPNRVKESMTRHIEEGAILTLCNAELIDKHGFVYQKSFQTEKNPLNNNLFYRLYHNPYTGNCMSIRRDLLEYILPFPANIAMHDIWIGLNAQKKNRCSYISTPLIQFRRHGSNFTATHKRPFWKKITYRLYLLVKLYIR